MKLTSEQKEAVTTIEGNVACIASAGSGKTASFTTRIAYMIETGIDPSSILAVTFTKKASQEMKKRISKLVGKEKADKVPIGTFHGIAYRILRLCDIEFSKMKIAPDWWRFGLFNDMCKESNDKNPNGLNIGLRAGDLGSFISYQKSNNIKHTEDILIDDNVDYVRGVSRSLLQKAYATYETLKRNSRQIDFDDMLIYLYEKLVNDDHFRMRLSNQFKYIMIDEYQDSPAIAKEVIKLINDKNVFVVGDFRQSIYKFINANVGNMLNFKDEFKDVKVIELNKNFRSTKNIVNLSNRIIESSNIDKYKDYKSSESIAEIGDQVDFTIYNSETVQVNNIAKRILNLNKEGTPLKEMAILVRTNAQTAVIEDVFAEIDIPYEVSKSSSFFDRKEIVDILSYARLAVNSHDDESMRRIYNTPNRYLSKQFIQELETFASDRDMSLLDAIKATPHNSEWKYKRNIEGLTRIISDLHSQVNANVNAGRMLRNIIKSTRYMDYINEKSTSASTINEKIESIEKLCEMGAKFPNIKAFLAHIGNIKDKQAKTKGRDAVQIITMHSSKGLEWDVCFVININEDVMPHEMNNDIEEERRLFYVACSRPRKKLFVSWCMYDNDYTICREGYFIDELLGKKTTDKMKKDLFRGNEESTFLYPSV